jgi:hypothetical protein
MNNVNRDPKATGAVTEEKQMTNGKMTIEDRLALLDAMYKAAKIVAEKAAR